MSTIEQKYYDLHYEYNVRIDTGICNICSNNTYILYMDNSEGKEEPVQLCKDCIDKGFEDV